jgi:hypothetical protein
MALSSGAALVGYLVAGLSLWVGLVVLVSGWSGLLFSTLRRGDPAMRARLRRVAARGAAAGLAATGCYDASRWALTRLDAMSVNPFEAIPRFGALWLGTDSAETARVVSGTAFHLINGVAFGVAFALLLPPYGLLRGIAWGLGLELFQLALYPGWLDIRAFSEFARVSALGHVVYGVVLGTLCRRLIGHRS